MDLYQPACGVNLNLLDLFFLNKVDKWGGRKCPGSEIEEKLITEEKWWLHPVDRGGCVVK